MKSIRQAASRLPEEFVEKLYGLYGIHQAEKIMRNMSVDRYTTLRVNTTKIDIHTLMGLLTEHGIKFERVPWNPQALVIKNKTEKAIEALDAYKDGAVYLQSLSSQIPPLVLEPKPGERVLDLTAAPGGKTTQIAAMMNNQGYVLAVEVNEIRGERLKHNVRVQGAQNIEVRIEDGKYTGRKEPESFDRVLLDAPCSGEGLFITDEPRTYRFWSPKEVKKCASEQRRLMSSAVAALKPGGILVYSTCTMSPEENEAIVDTALKRFPGKLKILDFSLAVPGAIRAFDEYGDTKYNRDVTKAMRILPSEFLEGFFVCKMQKLASTQDIDPES